MESFYNKFYSLFGSTTLSRIGSFFSTGLFIGWILKKSLKLLFLIIVLFVIGYLWFNFKMIDGDILTHGLHALPHMLHNLFDLLVQKLNTLDFLGIVAIIVGFLFGLILG